MKKILKKEKGITLIALVITIILLLILAGISIQTIKNTGLFEKAQQAKQETEKAEIKEKIQLDIYKTQLEDDSSLATILRKYGELIYEGGKIKGIRTEDGYEILLSDVLSGTITEDISIANVPNMNGFNKDNTYYVLWDLENSTYTINDSTRISETEPSDWYDYTSGVNHWANIKTTGGGNECYWVWIPRYAYKVPTKGSIAETIDVKFLRGKTNEPIDGTAEITNTTPTPGEWVVHPAFTNAGNGGFGELTGIWVAKFEASSSGVSEDTLTSDLETTGGGNATNLQVRVKPNVTSWRGITVNNIFTVCKKLTLTGNSLENTNSLDSHMMKNTEWGAVAYLSMSTYGKNGEVWNNPYTTNYSTITGLCSNETNGKDKVTADKSKTCKYNEAGGGNASTTGNVYGVYDMAGGAGEYIAGYLSGNTDYIDYYTELASADEKYKDIYLGTSSDKNINYNANSMKYGDAVYETSSSAGDDDVSSSWNSNISSYITPKFPVFVRGISPDDGGSYAGLFGFWDWTRL